LNVFAIRHKPTGAFMPVPTGRGGSGSSYWDPANSAFGAVPGVHRLFHNKRSAKAALTQWLRGRHVPVMEYASAEDSFFSSSFPYCVGTETEHDPSRKAEDMEIVEFTLTAIE
jgi:hypothetical protein